MLGEGLQALFSLCSQGMRQVPGEDGVSSGDLGGVVGVLCPVLWWAPVRGVWRYWRVRRLRWVI